MAIIVFIQLTNDDWTYLHWPPQWHWLLRLLGGRVPIRYSDWATPTIQCHYGPTDITVLFIVVLFVVAVFSDGVYLFGIFIHYWLSLLLTDYCYLFLMTRLLWYCIYWHCSIDWLLMMLLLMILLMTQYWPLTHCLSMIGPHLLPVVLYDDHCEYSDVNVGNGRWPVLFGNSWPDCCYWDWLLHIPSIWWHYSPVWRCWPFPIIIVVLLLTDHYSSSDLDWLLLIRYC